MQWSELDSNAVTMSTTNRCSALNCALVVSTVQCRAIALFALHLSANKISLFVFDAVRVSEPDSFMFASSLIFSLIFKWVFVLFFFNIYSFFSVYKVLLCTMYTVNSSTEFQSAPVFHFFYKALPYSLQVNQHIWNFFGILKPVYHKSRECWKGQI